MSTPESGLLSIIIVNFNSGKLIADCLESIYYFNEAQRFEVIIVDNSSNEADRMLITQAYPAVTWIDLKYNAGFARANNAGMMAATGDAFLLLNPDTLCLDNSIANCYQRLMNNNHVAAGVQLLDVNEQQQISGSYFVKGGLNHLLPIPYWGDVIRWAAYRANAKVPGVQHASAVQEVDWISGAFLMVKKTVVSKAGMMDEDFFLYGEEVEWCSRLKRMGPLTIYGDLRIVHLEGATINKSQNLQEQGYYNLYDRKGLQLMVSNHLRVRKQYGVSWFLILLLNYTWGVFFYFFCSTLHRMFTLRNPAGAWGKIGSFAANVLRIWSLAPKIISNKPYFYKMF